MTITQGRQGANLWQMTNTHYKQFNNANQRIHVAAQRENKQTLHIQGKDRKQTPNLKGARQA